MKSKQKWQELGDRFAVAGVAYTDYHNYIKDMKPGQRVRFIGERKNLYDNRAVRVEWEGNKIGYVPAINPLKFRMWELHKQGSILVGFLTAVNKNDPTQSMFIVQALYTEVIKPVTKSEGEVLFARLREECSYMNK